MEVKYCFKCGETKSVVEFYRDKSRRSGLANKCKQCDLAHTAIYRKTHKKEKSENHKKYFQTHKKEILECQKKYRAKRRKVDSGFRLRKRISNMISDRLKKRLSSKEGKSTFSFLPYTLEELMAHLEKQFKPGMTWENRSAWHIDHIRPDSLFDYKNVEDEEFQKCWALSNLQPLWATENLTKSNNIF